MTKNKYCVHIDDAVTGILHGSSGTFRLLLEPKTHAVNHFACLVNTMVKGVKGSAHKHEVDQLWYVLEGNGVMTIEGTTFPIGPGMAVSAPAGAMHKIDVGPDADLTYVVVYAPAGPEQQLKKYGPTAFAER